MDCSTPGFPVHHQLPELAQTHVHRVGDAIQPSHPLLSPSPPAFNLSWLYPFKSNVFNVKFTGGSVVKNLPAVQETQVQSLSQEDPLEKEMAIHSSILAWRIPWTEETLAT